MADLNQLNQLCKGTLCEITGIKITKASRGELEATMPVDERTFQPMRILHGGASVALAESVASIGANVITSEVGKTAVGQEINANHLRPVSSGTVRAVGKIVHEGKRSQVWEIKIYNEDNKLICISRCTMAVLD